MCISLATCISKTYRKSPNSWYCTRVRYLYRNCKSNNKLCCYSNNRSQVLPVVNIQFAREHRLCKNPTPTFYHCIFNRTQYILTYIVIERNWYIQVFNLHSTCMSRRYIHNNIPVPVEVQEMHS